MAESPEPQGFIVDLDEIRKSPAYESGHVERVSLVFLRERAAFITDWQRQLEPNKRGRFVAHLPTNSGSEVASRSTDFLLSSKKGNSLVQVTSQPIFEQADYEKMGFRHFTTDAFVPAAAMALRLMNTGVRQVIQ